MIVDLMTATQDAVFEALQSGVDPMLGEVRQHVKEGTQPPLVIVGDMDSEDQAGKDEQLERITVEIITIYRGADRSRLYAMMHAVRLALDGQSISTNEVAFSRPRFLTASSALADDGVTYAGVQDFEIFAEPA